MRFVPAGRTQWVKRNGQVIPLTEGLEILPGDELAIGTVDLSRLPREQQDAAQIYSEESGYRRAIQGEPLFKGEVVETTYKGEQAITNRTNKTFNRVTQESATTNVIIVSSVVLVTALVLVLNKDDDNPSP
jgi:hypothetical protein